MGATKKSENGKSAERTQVPLQEVSDPRDARRSGFQGRVNNRAVLGLVACAMAVAVALCTALVYERRLRTLQIRVDVLEQRHFDVETSIRDYVDQRLRAILLHHQVSAKPVA